MSPLPGSSGVARDDVLTAPRTLAVTVMPVWPGARRGALRLAVLVGACAILGLVGSASAWANHTGPPSPVITDFAGISGSGGTVTPGPATATTLGQGYGVAVDANGNVYIADYNASVIEKVTPDGTLSIVAGVQGSFAAPTPGQATSSDLDSPEGVAVAPDGDFYIADSSNNLVEKVTPDGTLSVIAGNGSDSPPIPGAATSSPLGDIEGVAVDQAGNVYIADPDNNVVEKVTSDGTLSILAGNGGSGLPTPGPAADSRLYEPEGVAVDFSGNVYIADYENSLIEKVTPSGTLSIFAGISGTYGAPSAGLATAEPLGGPDGVATNADGDVYIADYYENLVEKVTPDGMMSIVAGNTHNSPPTYGDAATDTTSPAPFGVAAEPDGTFFTADGDYKTVDRIGYATPGPPGQPTLTAGDGSAEMSFTAPIDPGTSAITSYQVSLDGGSTWQTITTTPGAGSTLTATLAALNDGTNYSVLVRAVNTSGGGAPSPSESVTPEALPTNSTPPTITGTPDVGATLTAHTGTWQGGGLTYTYQWLLDGSTITGATNATYALIGADAGHHISVRVTATNNMGQASATTTEDSVPAATPTPTTPTTASTPAGVDQTTTSTSVKGQSAVLGGIVAAHTNTVNYRFTYGASTRYGRMTTSTPLAASSTARNVSTKIKQLVPGRVYHYRLQVISANGTVSYGADHRLATPKVSPRHVRNHIYSYWAPHGPYHYTVKGRMVLIHGLTHPVACRTRGKTTITATLANKTVARHTVRVSNNCTYVSTFTFTTSQLTGSGRMSFHMHYAGNHQLRSRQARTLNVLYGPNAKQNS